MRTEEEIRTKLERYKQHLKRYSCYQIAHSEKEKVDYISQEGFIRALGWVLNESEDL
jgi:hypothetical protein